MHQLIYLILFLLYSCVDLQAQTREYLFSYIGEKDGLNEQGINAIQQDKKGYIWIATHNALQRYDGQRFLTFPARKNVAGAIPAPGIRSLIIDKKNRLWMITGHTRVGYFDVDRFVFHEVPVNYDKELLEKSGAGLFMDAAGNMMLILVGKAVLTYNDAANEMAQQYNSVKWPARWNVNHLWQHESSGIFWIGCDSGLVKFNPATQQLSYRGHNEEQDPYIKQFEQARTIINAFMDDTRRLWITYWPVGGMFIKSYRPGEKESANWRNIIDKALHGHYFELHGITSLKDGSLWMAGQNLLGKLNERTGEVDIIKNNTPGEYSIRYDRITRLMEDKEKNVWIGTDKGLFRFNPAAQVFTAVTNRLPSGDSIHSAEVADILQTKNGEILVSAWGAGVFAYDQYFSPVASRYVNRNVAAGEMMIWCMLQTKNGDIWKGSQDGYIFINEAGSHTVKKIQPEVFEKSTIRQMIEDKNGHIWFGTQRGYLIKWDIVTRQFTVEHKFKSIISRLYLDNNGHLWVCTANAGLYHLNGEGKMLHRYTAEMGNNRSLITNGTADIIQYNDSLYAVAGDGLNLLNVRAGAITHFDVDIGVPPTNISNLVKDRQGYVWMTCASGIANFHPFKNKFNAYNSLDGVHTNAFSLGSGTVLNDGRIVFGTSHDMLVFDPGKMNNAGYKTPRVEITGIQIHNIDVNSDSVSRLGELKLAYHQNYLSFQLSTLLFQNTVPVYYKMEHIDKEWRVADKLKSAVYSYLPPGNYVFQVAYKNADGSFGPINVLKVRIEAPFWKSWWFYGLLALAVLFIIYWLDKQRIMRMKREEDIRSSIAANLHQEVNATLQNINVLSEIAGMKADQNPEQSKDYIHEIKQKSRNMVTALNDVLWSIDPANDSMGKNIDWMRELAESLKNKYNADIELQVEEEVAKLKLDMKKRHEFISIYKLSIITLVKLLKASQTTIHLDHSKGLLNLKIYSRVNNFYKGNNAVIKNIHEIRQRAASVEANLDIQSDEKSTGIILSLKV